MKVLHICANPKPTEEAVSKQLAAAFFTKLVTSNPDAEMENVDLYMEQPPPYSYQEYRNFWYPISIDGYVPTKEEKAASEYAFTQAKMVTDADVLVLTMPMWHYGVPGIMKTWLEHVLSPGLLYEPRKGGDPKLKHKIKRLVLLVSSADSFMEDDDRDALTREIFNAFKDIGVNDISLAWADGQDEALFRDAKERKEMALEAAEELAEELSEELASC